ncbi:hypothetical protein [Paenibacillus sp. USDA918EY]|uniref:hypothetical protein n=1 Tax=Paenibacillus sp. USDA918EY TaxID=2689575 RepID=UPI00135AF11E|nr:hypothetical protein [Paenibacillus sp. USDA918EY]
MKETLRNAKSKPFLFILTAFFTLFIVIYALYSKPVITGDGREYLGMTISFVQHLSPELKESDILVRKVIESKNQINFPENSEYLGYYQSLKGEMFSYHFWFYSLLNTPVFIVMKLLHINELKSFQLTNCLLYVLLCIKILNTKVLTNKVRLFFLIASFLSPIVLYFKWTHTEVYSYVFLFLGLIAFLERSKKMAMLYVSLAALQNPAISIVAIYFLVHELLLIRKSIFKNKEILTRYLLLGVISSLNILPYLFYWIHFRKFSMITASGYSSLTFFSTKKVWSLFFDLNYGLIVYVPILLILLVIALLKIEKLAWISLVIVLLVAAVDATQLNWNSGMMYINRYSVWLIPFLLFGCIHMLNKYNTRKILSLILVLCITTGLTTFICFKEYDYSNYMKFSPIAKFIISKFPGIYNPEYETFIERAQGHEGISKDDFPLTMVNTEGVRKILEINSETSEMRYVNSSANFKASRDIFYISKMYANKDIFVSDIEAAFGRGWHSLESNQTHYRWTDESSILRIKYENSHEVTLDLKMRSFFRDRHCKIFVNGALVHEELISSDHDENIAINVYLAKGLNTIKIESTNGADKPSEVLGSLDSRALSFSISSFNIINKGVN